MEYNRLPHSDNVRQSDRIVPEKDMAVGVTPVVSKGRFRFFVCSLQFTGSVVSAVLRSVKQLSVFRVWDDKRSVCPHYGIVETNFQELTTTHTWAGGDNWDPDLWSRYDNEPGVTGYAARYDGELLGFVRLIRISDVESPRAGYWLYNLHVKPRYRGMGIGAALTRRVMDQAQSEGASELFLEALEDNVPALALYRKLGFEPVSLPALRAETSRYFQLFGRRKLTFVKTFILPTPVQSAFIRSIRSGYYLENEIQTPGFRLIPDRPS